MEHLGDGLDPAAAVASAITDVGADADRWFGPAAAAALTAATGVAEAIWVLARGPADDPLAEAS